MEGQPHLPHQRFDWCFDSDHSSQSTLVAEIVKKIVTILPTNVNENGNTVEKTEKCNQQEQ